MSTVREIFGVLFAQEGTQYEILVRDRNTREILFHSDPIKKSISRSLEFARKLAGVYLLKYENSYAEILDTSEAGVMYSRITV